uniref:Uncharacterized protein n=1 Tax=Megaselia scalaris TaxID=36166 RepID=T1GIF8_MEGSC
MWFNCTLNIMGANFFTEVFELKKTTIQTKWKRQTAVGLDLYSQLASVSSSTNAQTPTDIYYRQAAAAAALQKPLPFRMYPPVAINPMTIASHSTNPYPHMATAAAHTPDTFYPNENALKSPRLRSPPLDPGSPVGRRSVESENLVESDNDDDEDNIQV